MRPPSDSRAGDTCHLGRAKWCHPSTATAAASSCPRARCTCRAGPRSMRPKCCSKRHIRSALAGSSQSVSWPMPCQTPRARTRPPRGRTATNATTLSVVPSTQAPASATAAQRRSGLCGDDTGKRAERKREARAGTPLNCSNYFVFAQEVHRADRIVKIAIRRRFPVSFRTRLPAETPS